MEKVYHSPMTAIAILFSLFAASPALAGNFQNDCTYKFTQKLISLNGLEDELCEDILSDETACFNFITSALTERGFHYDANSSQTFTKKVLESKVSVLGFVTMDGQSTSTLKTFEAWTLADQKGAEIQSAGADFKHMADMSSPDPSFQSHNQENFLTMISELKKCGE
jgi:hypothetical protein